MSNTNDNLICGRPTKNGTPCKSPPVWDPGGACRLHLTDDERRAHYADKDYESVIREAEWAERARLRREGEIMRYLAGLLERFAPFTDDETKMARRYLDALLDCLPPCG